MSPARILFYAQYLKGIGHVIRARRIVEELCRRGADVTLVIGGNVIPNFEVAGARVQQLPPLAASARSYSRLVKADGEVADAAYLAERRDHLLAVFDDAAPDVLITEAFPFGRWAMQFELEPLLARADRYRRRPIIMASLRDILQMPKTPEKVDLSTALCAAYYDRLLVHGDPKLVAIEESFPPIVPFLEKVRYTGIVAPDDALAAGARGSRLLGERFDVIVSGGGGAIGYDVLRAAIEAKPATALADGRWLAVAGPRMTQEAYAALERLADLHDVQLERNRPDLGTLIAAAKLSIQRAGYNTVAELIGSRCRAVLVPDSANGQMEQPIRAEKLQELGRAVVVAEGGLTSATMAAGIGKALAEEPQALSLARDGAARSADFVFEALNERVQGGGEVAGG